VKLEVLRVPVAGGGEVGGAGVPMAASDGAEE
jgi:hypothetical protein